MQFMHVLDSCLVLVVFIIAVVLARLYTEVLQWCSVLMIFVLWLPVYTGYNLTCFSSVSTPK